MRMVQSTEVLMQELITVPRPGRNMFTMRSIIPHGEGTGLTSVNPIFFYYVNYRFLMLSSN